MGRVVVVGGGPTGLWLAAELALAAVDVTIVEKRPQRSPASRGFTIHPRTMELWAGRGIADRFLSEGRTVPNSHYGLLETRLDYGVLDTPFPFILVLGQRRVEELLEAHALSLGVEIRRGHAVTGVTAQADSVTLRIAGPSGEYDLAGDYVAGCDGAGSLVRGAAGIAFEGTESTAVAWFADVRLGAPPPVPYYQKYGPKGGVFAVPLGPDLYRIGGMEAAPERPEEQDGTYTADELAAKLFAVTGEDFQLSDPTWVSRTGSATRLAGRYSDGRVFLAGDAAHRIFPAGGVGLNVGLQDATNLGWKLAAAMRGWAPGGLLDTYHEERHAVGADLVESTRAQLAVMTRFDPETLALRSVLNAAIARMPQFSRILAGQVSGLDTYYPPRSPDAHALVGTRAPDIRLAGGTGLFALLGPARYVLLDLTGGEVLGRPVLGGSVLDGSIPEPVIHFGALAEDRAGWQKVRGVLVRPDGHVAWASEEADDDLLRSGAAAAFAATHR